MLKSCSVFSQNLTYEIILTLGQAFEVAYQLALQAQKSRSLGPSTADMIETKSSKPVPKPRVGTRKSAVRGLQAPRPPLTPWASRAWGGTGTGREPAVSAFPVPRGLQSPPSPGAPGPRPAVSPQ